MVIATSGSGYSINYNRIISSITSPNYSVVVSDSNTYRDSAGWTTINGLFIIDKDHIVSLMQSGYYTFLAILDLTIPHYTYKQSLPSIDVIQTSVFVSASVFYTPS